MSRLINLIGRRFGRIKILKQGKKSNANAIRWIGQCDCGNPTLSTSQNLRLGHTSSCGCFRKTVAARRRSRPYESLYNILVGRCDSKRAVARNGAVVPRSWGRKVMSFRSFLTFTKVTTCHYCGDTVTWLAHNVGRNACCNLDRVDNNKDYSKKNCVVCCGACNAMKSTLCYEAFLNRVDKISKNWRKHTWQKQNKLS